MEVIPVTYKWAHSLVHRNGAPAKIVWHHSAGTGSAQQIHAMHVAIGDSGIAYHYYVRRDGRIYRGRPEWAMGAHCLGHNDWLGVCAEGNYDSTREMPSVQLRALQWLHGDIHKRRAGIGDIRHKDVPGNATACPGRYYPEGRRSLGGCHVIPDHIDTSVGDPRLSQPPHSRRHGHLR